MHAPCSCKFPYALFGHLIRFLAQALSESDVFPRMDCARRFVTTKKAKLPRLLTITPRDSFAKDWDLSDALVRCCICCSVCHSLR